MAQLGRFGTHKIGLNLFGLILISGFPAISKANPSTQTQFGTAVEMPVAYQKVAQDFGIPPEVLFAVMLTESGKQISLNDGRTKTALHGSTKIALSESTKTALSGSTKIVPWPWTLNVELKSYYFKTQSEAKLALRKFIAADNKRIAVGLGQIYLPSHGHLFPDVTELLEPGLNLYYAAQLLANNFKWTVNQGNPNWWVAVGRYHTPSRLDLAMPYREDVYRHCERFSSTCSRYGSIARNEIKFNTVKLNKQS